MFARLVEATAKPGKRDEIDQILRNDLLPALRRQQGFVDLIGLAGDANPNVGGGLSLWNSKNDADAFYSGTEFANLISRVKPLLEDMKVHTFDVTISTFHKIAAASA